MKWIIALGLLIILVSGCISATDSNPIVPNVEDRKAKSLTEEEATAELEAHLPDLKIGDMESQGFWDRDVDNYFPNYYEEILAVRYGYHSHPNGVMILEYNVYCPSGSACISDLKSSLSGFEGCGISTVKVEGVEINKFSGSCQKSQPIWYFWNMGNTVHLIKTEDSQSAHATDGVDVESLVQEIVKNILDKY